METKHNEPKYIRVKGARVHNLKNVNVDVPCTRSWGSQVCPVRANLRWHLVFCMQRVPDDIWSHFLLIQEGV